MASTLLVIENLVMNLLLVAIVLACVGRLHRRWLRNLLWIPIVLGILSVYVYLVIATAFLQFHVENSVHLFFPTLALAVLFLLGGIWLVVAGLRYKNDEPSPTAAGTWPRAKLTIALVVVVALNLITYSNIDLSSRLQLEALRGEAGALALSVAPPRVSDRDNAAILYEQAFEGLSPMNSQDKTLQEKWKQWTQPGEMGLDVNDPDLRQFLKNHVGRIALLHKAAEKPGCYFEHNYHYPTFCELVPEVHSMQDAVKLLALDARVKASDGDILGAIQDINSILGISEHIGATPFLVTMLVAITAEDTAVKTLQDILADANASPEDLAMICFEDRLPYQTMLERALCMGEATRLMAFCEISTGEMDLRYLIAEENYPNGWLVVSLYRGFLLPRDLADHRRLSQEQRQAAAQLRQSSGRPYSELEPYFVQIDWQWQSKSTGMLTRMLKSSLVPCSEAVVKAAARRQAVRLGLAAERYRASNSRFPDSLDELVPDYISAIPSDPFDGKPMRMKRTPNGCIFYSIGPDMLDNQGDSFDENSQLGDITFTVSNRQDQASTSK